MADNNEMPKQAEGDAFYLVLRDKPNSYVSFRHASYDEAYKEAQRLSKKEHCKFYVLQTVTVVESMQTILSHTIEFTQ